MNRCEIEIDLEGVKAEKIYHGYRGFEVKTFLLSFSGERKRLSARHGFKNVRFVGNHYIPQELWEEARERGEAYLDKIIEDLDLDHLDVPQHLCRIVF